nr:hypothetical protein [Stakelama flava]
MLPGLVFKAVVIGGGYATGRELVEFFLTLGPRGGLYGMAFALVIWSAVCVVAFVLAYTLRAFEYRALFRALLGPAWPVFELFYLLFLVLILAVMTAAAGEIGAALFGMPLIAGTVALMLLVALFTSFGSDVVERMFRFTSVFLYAVYALFLVLSLSRFGDAITESIGRPAPVAGWGVNGATYASYNIVAAIAVLPFLRHLTRKRDAVVAGALAGPLAMLPALAFFLCMTAFYPTISDQALPSDFLLRKLDAPWFHLLFQLMIFCALLETGVGVVNLLHERVADALAERDRDYSVTARLAVGTVVLAGSGFAAVRVGLVDLIATGYSAFGYIMLGIVVLPMLTIGLWRVAHGRRTSAVLAAATE